MNRRYKMLPLDFPFNEHPKFWWTCLINNEKIEPVFNRNGYFLDRKTGRTWLEIDGQAWIYRDRIDFEYRLRTSRGNNRITEDIFVALALLIKVRLASPKQKQLYKTEEDIRLLRLTYLSARLAAYKFLKECRNRIK